MLLLFSSPFLYPLLNDISSAPCVRPDSSRINRYFEVQIMWSQTAVEQIKTYRRYDTFIEQMNTSTGRYIRTWNPHLKQITGFQLIYILPCKAHRFLICFGGSYVFRAER